MSLETLKTKVGKLIEKAQSGGGVEELENLWYTISGNWTNMPNGFRNAQVEILPKMNYSKITSLSYAFSTMPLKRVDQYLNTENCTNFNTTFGTCKQLEYVKGINLSKATFVNSCFVNCTALKTIEEPIDFSYLSVNSTENSIHMFSNTTALETIRIVPESIKKHFLLASTSVLTPESIISIIDGLATVETAQTLTLHADVKILQSQVDSANAKGWTVAGGTVVSEEEYYG